MTQPRRQPRLVRVPDAFLPAALAAFSILRPGDLAGLYLYAAALIVSALSLFAGRAVRLAFAQQPAIRHVRGSVKSALLMTLAGTALTVAAALIFRQAERFPTALIAAGGLLNIEHIFYEYMYAIGDRRSAALSRGLTALFTLAGALLSAENTLWLTGMAALSALVALVVSLVMGDGTAGRLDGALLRCAPRAAIQSALYPATALAVFVALKYDRAALPFFTGLMLYELCRTPFRRSSQEARGFNAALLITGAFAALGLFAAEIFAPDGWRSLPGMTCAMVLLAALCAFALYGNIHTKNE